MKEPDYYVKSTEFPQYDGVIPQMNTKFISYDLELVGLENLLCFSTRLESTTAVFSYGHDLFYARVNPEANFDRLGETFKAGIFMATLATLVIALIVAGKYIKKRDTHADFLLRSS